MTEGAPLSRTMCIWPPAKPWSNTRSGYTVDTLRAGSLSLTIEDLKAQRRWVLWRLETVTEKLTKVPYQPNGRKAMANNPVTWHTHPECAAVVSQFSGVGVPLGDVDGVHLWGVDIDGCCDAVTGKFTPE